MGRLVPTFVGGGYLAGHIQSLGSHLFWGLYSAIFLDKPPCLFALPWVSIGDDFLVFALQFWEMELEGEVRARRCATMVGNNPDV